MPVKPHIRWGGGWREGREVEFQISFKVYDLHRLPVNGRRLRGLRSLLPCVARGTLRAAGPPSWDGAGAGRGDRRIDSSQLCFLRCTVFSFRGAECPVNHGSNRLQNPQPSNKKQISHPPRHFFQVCVSHASLRDNLFCKNCKEVVVVLTVWGFPRENLVPKVPLFFLPKGSLWGLNGPTKQTTPSPFYSLCYLLGFP